MAADAERLPPRVLNKIEPEPNSGCWLWIGCRNSKGYGMISVGGTMLVAARVVYEHTRGPIPPGLELDHLCRTPPCVNPDHVEPVTHRENMLRSPTAAPAVHARQTACIHGHALDGLTAQGRRCLTCKRADGKRLYRLRIEAGLCVVCAEPAVEGVHCGSCAQKILCSGSIMRLWQ